MKNIKIAENDEGQRADVFLSKALDITRNQVQKLIKQGQVSIDKKIINSHYKIAAGEVLELKDENIYEGKSDPKKAEEKIKIDLDKIIVKDTKNYLVINKPPMLVVHEAEGVKEKTLVDFILERYPFIKKIGEDPTRPGVVHRLDREASGLMVIAKTQDFFDYMKDKFQKRKVKKTYGVLVHGKIEKDTDRIEFPITRSRLRYKMAALPLTSRGFKNTDGKKAITEISVEKRYINYTLLEVKILTGRTHQIRCHMAAYGNPVAGDNVYSTKKLREKNKKINLERLFLVSQELSFMGMDGHKVKYGIELPASLNNFLSKLK